LGDRPGPLALALSSCTWNCAGPPIKGPRKAGIDKTQGTPTSRARGGAPYPVRISITRPTRGAAAAEGAIFNTHTGRRYSAAAPAVVKGSPGLSPSCGPAANPPGARKNRSRGTAAAAVGTIRSNHGPESRKLDPAAAAAATAPAAARIRTRTRARRMWMHMADTHVARRPRPPGPVTCSGWGCWLGGGFLGVL
jgi:hypothetical protein